VENLVRIVGDGCLVSDREMIERGGPAQAIGMSEIKRRRVEQLEVACHPGTKVGDYVPFYFCPRSIMLFVIHRANHAELTYRGGQGPIVHLVADLHDVVRWADEQGGRWCFSLSNAGAVYTEFRHRLEDLRELDWSAIAETDFPAPKVRKGKQAEFLLHGGFPLALVERIGVLSVAVQARVRSAFASGGLSPTIELRPEWYY
jgi:hypothetical protein